MLKPAPRHRKTKPTITAQLTEAWRVAQDLASTAERRHVTASLVATEFPTADNLLALATLLSAWHDAQRAAATARNAYMAHVRVKLSAAAAPGSVRDLAR